jgi:hypothetical protein
VKIDHKYVKKNFCWVFAWFGLVIFGAFFPVHCQGTEIFLSPDRYFPLKKTAIFRNFSAISAIFPQFSANFFWGGPLTAIRMKSAQIRNDRQKNFPRLRRGVPFFLPKVWGRYICFR